MNHIPENRCASSVYVKFSKNFIYSCGIILIIFSWALYLVVLAYGTVGEGVLWVTTLVYGAVILRATLGVTGVSTLGDAVYPVLCAGDVCTTIRGEPSLFIRAWNRLSSCLRSTNWVSPMCENCASGLGFSNTSIKYLVDREEQSADDIHGIFCVMLIL